MFSKGLTKTAQMGLDPAKAQAFQNSFRKAIHMPASPPPPPPPPQNVGNMR